jgi:nucleoid DNA-binding protein
MCGEDLVDAVFEKIGLSKREAQDIIEVLLRKSSA